MRYCDIKETHLLKISFCDHRGDFFACSGSESLSRRRKQPSHTSARPLFFLTYPLINLYILQRFPSRVRQKSLSYVHDGACELDVNKTCLRKLTLADTTLIGFYEHARKEWRSRFPTFASLGRIDKTVRIGAGRRRGRR